jgi:hypothetical protein
MKWENFNLLESHLGILKALDLINLHSNAYETETLIIFKEFAICNIYTANFF